MNACRYLLELFSLRGRMRILIVEDEKTLARRIQDVLKNNGYTVDVAFDGASGLEQALMDGYDLVVLDILLPKLNGIRVLQEIRAAGLTLPVLLLTAKNAVEDKVQGLDAGADDYLTKPFAVPELLARIRSLLRRSISGGKQARLQAGDLTLDTVTHEVYRNNQLIDLTAREYAILEFLLYNKNRVVSRLSIAEHVWGDHFDPFSMTNFVDVHIKNLRKKILDVPDHRIIRTVRGIGYRIKDEDK